MNENKDLDRMMEDFLSDNRVEDREFSDKVMTALPQQPKLVWVTSLAPVLGIFVAMAAVWQFGFVTPEKLNLWMAKLSVLWNVNVGVSATVSIAAVIGVAALAGYFVSEKIKNM
jgi:hypothetical protein